MSKRKYRKRSDYWSKFEKKEQSLDELINKNQDTESWSPGLYGESEASFNSSNTYNRSGGQKQGNLSRQNRASTSKLSNRYEHIHAGLLPYKVSSDGVDVREAIELCQKAYANIAIFRNALDILSELANSQLILKGGNESSRDFISKWFTKIKVRKLKSQYFREYYRSGNIFLYRVDGKFKAEDFKNLNKIYASESLKAGQIPLRYILMNPFDMIAERASSFSDGMYKKLLSEYEIQNLKTPGNEFDKAVLNSLPPKIRKAIKEGNYSRDGMTVPLDEKKLITSFYKKQDYEPFAIPFGFPVLDDINRKLELKNMDQAIARAVQQAILLITMGAKEDDGGVNPNSMRAMQELFQNESVGRVLVSDYTTKAEFVIPDIKKVVGIEKYEVINQDIKEGLQNIIVGSEKFSNTQTKAKIFLERLKEAREDFLSDFLQPQIIEVCRNMGFKSYPVAEFVRVDIEDEVQLQRVATRLIELGVLTPEQGIEAIKTGIYPESDDLGEAQEKYVEKRGMGHYNPLVGGMSMIEPAGAEERRKHDEKLQQKQLNNPQGNQDKPRKNPTKENGRPTGANAKELYGFKQIKDIVNKTEELRTFGQEKIKEFNSIKRLSAKNKELVNVFLESIVKSSEIADWELKMEACIKDESSLFSLQPKPEVLDISQEHSLHEFPSAILYHSQRIEE